MNWKDVKPGDIVKYDYISPGGETERCFCEVLDTNNGTSICRIRDILNLDVPNNVDENFPVNNENTDMIFDELIARRPTAEEILAMSFPEYFV